jgi:hypothetical protein
MLNPLNSLCAIDSFALHFGVSSKNVGKFYSLHILCMSLIFNDLVVF